MRVVALIGDGHTHLDLPPSSLRYQVESQWFAPLGDLSSWRLATGEKPPLYLQRLTEPWWTESLPDGQTIYFSFTRYPPDAEFRERAVALGRRIDESHARRLVIDLRRNGGGDLDQFRRLLLPIIKARSAINRKGGCS